MTPRSYSKGQLTLAVKGGLGTLAATVLTLVAVAWAEEQPNHQVLTGVGSTTLSGYVTTVAVWNPTSPPTPNLSFLGITNGHAELLLDVMSGRTNRVQVSTNLVTWEVVGTVVVLIPAGESAHAASVSMTHSNAAQLPCFYYRIAELP